MLKRNKKGQFVKTAKTSSRKTSKRSGRTKVRTGTVKLGISARKIKSAGRGGRVKSSTAQTGFSDSALDRQFKARKPGKRKSASGNTYYERRKNRSDKTGMRV